MGRLSLPALFALGAAAVGAQGVDLGFLKNSPIAFFQQEDVDLMLKNARAVLDSTAANAKQAWSNPHTGASGFAQITGQFTTSDGTHCKRLRVFNKVSRVEGESTYPVCKLSDRGWVIDVDARPAK